MCFGNHQGNNASRPPKEPAVPEVLLPNVTPPAKRGMLPVEDQPSAAVDRIHSQRRYDGWHRFRPEHE